MSDPQDQDDLSSKNASDAERFVQENKQIDLAYATGNLGQWIQEKLAREWHAITIGSDQPNQPAT